MTPCGYAITARPIAIPEAGSGWLTSRNFRNILRSARSVRVPGQRFWSHGAASPNPVGMRSNGYANIVTAKVTGNPVNVPPALWLADQSAGLLWMEYADVLASKRAAATWLRAILEQGIGFLQGVPAADGKVLDIARLLGYVRETNYGRIFNVRPVTSPSNLAYSERGLGVHTDNPYREPVPGLQILHCLQADEGGGDSLFVDGFAVAAELRSQDSPAFDTLARVMAPFAFRDDGVDLQADRHLIELTPDRRVRAVHYNSRSIRPVSLPSEELEAFYHGYRALSRLLRDRRFEFRVKLASGDLVAFNNRRVLHGRTAYSPSAGRWLQGCYVDYDGLTSNLAVLERKL